METYLKLLEEFIKFKSISTDDSYKPEIDRAAEWLKSKLEGKGFDVELATGYGNPIIVASYQVDPGKNTCLVYGHYDVQPASIDDGWAEDPFTLRKTENRLYARGVIDNKGQHLVHLATIFNLIDSGGLNYNIKLMIEGDEETGSEKMEQFIKDYAEKLSADFSLISDGEVTQSRPVIELGFRGGFNSTLTIITSDKDLHSGAYGGLAPSAAHELVKLLSKIFGAEDKVLIPEFYKDVATVTSNEAKLNSSQPFSVEEYKTITGVKALFNASATDPYTQNGLVPAIEVTGISAGYNGTGYRNSIPATASAKINFRLVANQDPYKIAELFEVFVKENLPDYCEYKFEAVQHYLGIKLDMNEPHIIEAARVLEEVYGSKPLYKYVGGGLPIVTYFAQMLKIPAVAVPLANEDCNMHAVDENFDINYLNKALKFSKLFFS